MFPPHIFLFNHLFIKAKSCITWLLIHFVFAFQMHAFIQQMFECPLCLGREWWTEWHVIRKYHLPGKWTCTVRENRVLEGSESPKGEGSDSAGVGKRSLKTWGGGSDAGITGWGGACPGMGWKAWCGLLAGFSSGKAVMGSGPWTRNGQKLWATEGTCLDSPLVTVNV